MYDVKIPSVVFPYKQGNLYKFLYEIKLLQRAKFWFINNYFALPFWKVTHLIVPVPTHNTAGFDEKLC